MRHETKQIGRWVKPFGGRRSFAQEISGAEEIHAEWTIKPEYMNVIVDHIDGWVEPLWGSDQNWLYLRRPEGVWKTKIPSDTPHAREAYIYQKNAEGFGVLGGLSIGASIINQGGWIRRAADGELIDAADLDAEESPISHGVELDVQRLRSPCGRELEATRERLILDLGDGFDRAPKFSKQGNWLVAHDVATNQSEAYQMDDDPDLWTEIQSGRLYFCYCSPWMEKAVTVKVVLEPGH